MKELRGKKLLIIGAGIFQIPAIKKAKKLGCFVIATDVDPSAPGFLYADAKKIVDVKDVEGNGEVGKQYGIDGVMSIVAELGVRTAADVAYALDLQGLKPECARAATDKFLMREIFAQKKLPSPLYKKAFTIKEAQSASEALGFPIVVKPVDSSGSRGVSKVDRIDELEKAFSWAKEYSQNGSVIIETFVEGEEVTVEALSYKGDHQILAISGKKHIPFPYCVSIDLTYPPLYDEGTLESIRILTKKALTALGIDSGPSHSEILMTKDGPVLVEIAARGGGYGVFSDIIELVSGVDIVKESITIALGSKPDIYAKYQKAATLRFFTPGEGKIAAIVGVEQARALPGVRIVSIALKPGDSIDRIVSDGTRPGYVITYGDTRQEAIARANAVEQTIKFILDPKP